MAPCRDIASAIKDVLDAVNEVSRKHQTDQRMREYKKVCVWGGGGGGVGVGVWGGGGGGGVCVCVGSLVAEWYAL